MKHWRFLLALWKANILSTMEYRAAFITQVVGMMLNDGFYFLFWVIFFGRFEEINSWGLQDMFILFGLVAAGFGLGAFLFGNTFMLSEIISKGQLDYYLALPRPVLLHTIASRSLSSGLGDFLYGLLSFAVARQLGVGTIARFILGTLLSMIIFLSFMIAVNSLAFWLGNTQMLGNQVFNALVTFSIYPINLFEGGARFLLYTLIPAAFIGAVPAGFVSNFSWQDFWLLLGVASLLLFLAIFVFNRGLRHYESGSAIQVQV